MGAATALMHGDRDPSIASMVLDSPFSNLRQLSEELAKSYSKIPKFVVSIAMNFIRKTIISKAGFDINDLAPINHVDRSFIPALFIAAKDDTFIQPHHAKALYEAYNGDKTFKIVEGDHNSQRPKFILDSIAIFFYQTLQCQSLPSKPKNYKKSRSQKESTESIYNQKFIQEQIMQSQLREQEERELLQAIEESLKMQNSKNEELKQ